MVGVQANQVESDKKIAEANQKAAEANQQAAEAAERAAELGVTLGTLDGFVNQKQREADAKLEEFRLFAEQQRQKTDMAVVELSKSTNDLKKAQQDSIQAAELSGKTLQDLSSRGRHG